ncbi:MAG: 2-oxoglutarate dehydrogenase E1 component, partial [Terriglobales bacterium]
MATRSKPASEAAATGVLEAPNGDRERVFDPFRHWGYLEADLDPLGFLPLVSHPELRADGELAQEARRIYCGTVGAEFMHITDPARRRWIQERMEGPQTQVDQE